MNTFIGAWDRFWFSSNRQDSLKTLAAFRICFCFVLFVFYVTRQFDVSFLYGENGIFPAQYAASQPMFKYHPSLLYFIHSDSLLSGVHFLLILFLALSVLGLFTRFSLIAAYILHLSFIHRNPSVMFGMDMISTFFLFYLCFARSNAYYSLDQKLFKNVPIKSTTISFLAHRLMQLQICVIYAFAGMEKLKGTRWWDGSAMWDVMSIGTMQRWDMSFLSHIPFLLSLGGYIVILWEIYFSFLVWQPKLKKYVLGMGVLMHIGIWLFMNLPGFGFMMMSLYILFLSGQEISKLFRLSDS